MTLHNEHASKTEQWLKAAAANQPMTDKTGDKVQSNADACLFCGTNVLVVNAYHEMKSVIDIMQADIGERLEYG